MKDTKPPDTIPNPDTMPSRPSLRFDVNDWLSYIEDEDATYEQKVELINRLGCIVAAFVDLGWEIKSGPESCGEDADLYTLLTSGMVELDSNQNDEQEAEHDR